MPNFTQSWIKTRLTQEPMVWPPHQGFQWCVQMQVLSPEKTVLSYFKLGSLWRALNDGPFYRIFFFPLTFFIFLLLRSLGLIFSTKIHLFSVPCSKKHKASRASYNFTSLKFLWQHNTLNPFKSTW